MNLGAEAYMLHGLFLLIYLGVFGDPFPSDDPCLSSLYYPNTSTHATYNPTIP